MEDDSSIVGKSVIGALAIVALIVSITLGLILGFVLGAPEVAVLLGGAIGFGLAAALFTFSVIYSKSTTEG